jgi:hypothetical protein
MPWKFPTHILARGFAQVLKVLTTITVSLTACIAETGVLAVIFCTGLHCTSTHTRTNSGRRRRRRRRRRSRGK